MIERGWLLFLLPVAVVVIIAVLLPPAEPQIEITRPTAPTPEPRPTVALPDHPAFSAGDDFDPIPEPGPIDWLSVHRESGQSYDGYVRGRSPKTDGSWTSIDLVPLIAAGSWSGPDPEVLRRFASAYFALPAKVMPSLDVADERVTTRMLEGVGPPTRQVLTHDLLDLLRKQRTDRQTVMLGVTTEDLYPGDEWNFVFGQASLSDRVAVYSFARYDPAFWGEPTKGAEAIILRRSLKVLAHETAHMFGIRHCTAFHCVMNGSNHLDESDASPLHLCPIDLAKLQHAICFDPADRYRALAAVYRDLGMEKAAVWIDRRLEKISRETIYQ